MPAPPHPDQSERLKTLKSFDVLDTARDSDFDEIVELASRICDTPISLISLVDDSRQWFKAEVGLGVQETDLDRSVCAHAILEDAFLEVPDTRIDDRTRNNPLNLETPHMRFYAGAQLIAPNGLPLGTLCVLDTKPRTLTDLQRQALKVLSRQVMKQLELRRALRDQETLLHEADHRVKNSLQTLASIVRLYGRNLTDPQAIDAFEAVRRRIEAIGALHSELQNAIDLNRVNVRAFLDKVIGLLRDSAPPHVEILLDAEDFVVGHGVTSALGVIVSEFVANSIKHGFPDDRPGTVSIGLHRTTDSIVLTCVDDGVGSRDPETDSAAQDNLGSTLVAAAASQLNGALSTELTANGSRLTLTF